MSGNETGYKNSDLNNVLAIIVIPRHKSYTGKSLFMTRQLCLPPLCWWATFTTPYLQQSASDNGTPSPRSPWLQLLPCTHLRTCRFLSSGSARNPPADSAATGRHWSSSCPLPVTAPSANDGEAPTVHENRYFEEKHTASENPSPDPM